MAARVAFIWCVVAAVATLNGGEIAYRTWAKTKSFDAGDTVVFNWTGTHDVAEVSETDYDNCTKTNPIGTIQSTSPYSVTLSSNGSRYFICTVSTHCEMGQKVALTVGAASSLTAGALAFFCSAIVFSLFSHL
ncbi:hypothetical protein CDL15_Pgr005949 [Punica granatum]|uniref:Phytocyanin domain-containing protein n=1 Tax=Punica granatum TaxID=22663 RepID=A0A218WHR2_PUNGR|nr:hypothetical protein CDL15_Pgr005949 [Punica granatum]PKI52387.1 hypothetical protein CRG98_027215 [Punica granatum]